MAKKNSLLCITKLLAGLLLTCTHHGAAANHGPTVSPSPELLPFGIAVGDVRGPTGDDSASSAVILYVPFTFIGIEYRQIFVNSNGVLSFERSFTSCCGTRMFPDNSPPLIAPFWHDFNPSIGGNIYYRQTNDPQQLQLYNTRLSTALTTNGLSNDFFPTLLFIATWDQVPQFSGSRLVNNTLQVVLATDNVQTLAMFIYKDINWGERAQIGFNVGDGYTSFVFPEALSHQSLTVHECSNVEQPGVYVYRIDKPPLLKLSGILPFGVNTSDVPGPPGDDSSSKPLTLGVPFPFFGREYNKIIVNSNGVLSFDSTFTNCCPPRNFPLVSAPLIAPFWLDFDLTNTSEGGIYYRQTNDSIYLELIHTLLLSSTEMDNIGDLADFLPTHLFIATWEKVPQYLNRGSIQNNPFLQAHNTFQVLLSTDGSQTVSTFIYHDITWGVEAQIGFNAGDGRNSFTIPEALSYQTLSINQLSNIGEPGIFVYRIDVPPNQAHALMVESSESTTISITWQPPTLNSLHVLYYIINANNVNSTTRIDGITQVNTTNNATSFNMTGLLPGTTYKLTVEAAFEENTNTIFVSQPSSFVTATTGFTVPALTCNTPVSSEGVITVTWSYIHTGGLPLTNLFLTYIYTFDGSVFAYNDFISVSSVNTTSVVVSDLTAGAEYTFNITAKNNTGSSNILCGPTSHTFGLPAGPVFGHLVSGPNEGQVTVSVESLASGIDSQSSEVFWFVITPIHDGIEGERAPHLFVNYRSGAFETIIIDGLKGGESYTFNATAVNKYGGSLPTTSISVLAGEVSMVNPTPSEKGRLPAAPVFGHLLSGPNGGQVTVLVQSPASGIDGQSSEAFWFVITPIINGGIEGESISHLSLNYQSGTFESIIIDGLEEGELYVFNATAVNMYGSSLTVTSIISTLAGAASTPSEKGSPGNSATSNTIGILIGGISGIGAIIVLVIVLLLVLILMQARRKAEINHVESILMSRVVNAKSELETKSEALYEEPGELLGQPRFQQVSL